MSYKCISRYGLVLTDFKYAGLLIRRQVQGMFGAWVLELDMSLNPGISVPLSKCLTFDMLPSLPKYNFPHL